MKTIINGIKIVKNEASLYVNGRMQYQAVNLVEEYGQRLNGCKYAIASKHPQWKMEKRFSKSLDRFRPYIFMTTNEFRAVRESQQNNEKYHKREVNNHDGFGFTDEITEALHECEVICSDPEPDVLTRIVEAINDEEFEKKKTIMRQAMDSLPEVQRRRALLFFVEGKSYREIAEIEGTYHSSVKKSVEAAQKKIEKYFKKYF